MLMKRIGNLYHQICSIENLRLAEKKARRGKGKQKGVMEFDLAPDGNLDDLRDTLINRAFKTSEYDIFKIFEKKERIIYKLPFFPDRIVHHAIMNVLEKPFVNSFTWDTYNCIKGRGIHKAFRKVKLALKDRDNTQYCLKLDIHKFYPSVNHDILKMLLRKKFKDADLLAMLDEIIDSAEGLPIGNYLSQYLANFYLTYFDHWIKQDLKVKYYFRYCDDLVIFSSDKKYLHDLKLKIEEYLKIQLDLKVKSNYQVFPVESRGVDFLGYRFYHDYVLIRKSIKNRFVRMIRRNKNSKSIDSYNGWLIHCDSINLRNKYLNDNKQDSRGVIRDNKRLYGCMPRE